MLRSPLCALVVTAALAACGGKAPDSAPPSDASSTPASPAAGAAPTGTVIEVKAISDEKGNRFEPNQLKAKAGDVIRFTLTSGVHNVSWPADKNPAGTKLPDASEVLQLPGQSLDIPVSFAPGHYAFQCDPHAALGMTGTLDVTQ